MFNASDLLGTLLQGGGPRGHSTGRLEHAMGDRGLGGAGGPLGQILGGLGGGGGGVPRGTPGYQGGGMGGGSGGGDILGGLAGMLGGGGRGGMGGGGGLGGMLGGGGGGLGGMLGGGGGRPVGRDLMVGGLGALAASVLSGRGRGGGMGGGLGGMGGGNMRGAVGAGGLALLGMLAMKALRNSGGAQQAPAPGMAPAAGGLGSAFGGGSGGDPDAEAMPPEQTTSDQTAGLVLRAMIDAAKADGRVDATERQRIVAKAQEDGADPEAAAYLERELARPADPDGLAAEAARDPVVAAQVYAASLLAIQVDTQEERDYLRALASKLGLQPAVVAQLHGALGAPSPA